MAFKLVGWVVYDPLVAHVLRLYNLPCCSPLITRKLFLFAIFMITCTSTAMKPLLSNMITLWS